MNHAPYTMRRCPECLEWFPEGNPNDDTDDPGLDHFEKAHPEKVVRIGKYATSMPFFPGNEFAITDEAPSGLTPCCQSFLTGTDEGLACKGCYTLYNG